MSITSRARGAAEEVTQTERERESMRKSRVYEQRISPGELEAFCGMCYTYCFNDLGFFLLLKTQTTETQIIIWRMTIKTTVIISRHG